ncbi:MAG: ABC transporter permease [Oscillospiraceae bacterium]|nr:ABC transporter permease [Oscillospiraceae bacterium]
MRTDKIRALILLYIVAFAALLSLTVYGQSSMRRFGQKSQLLAAPQARGGAGVDIWDIEDIQTEESTLITYEIRAQVVAGAIRQDHRMNVIGANSSYNGVMGYPVANGGFFSKEAFLLGSREAVLNERAASALFGGGNLVGNSFILNNESWMVVGVIMDGDDGESNIYVPASSELISALSGAGGAGSGGVTAANTSVAADALMVLQDGYSAADASLAIGKLAGLGFSDSSHTFLSLGKATAAFGEAAHMAQCFALALLLVMFAWRLALSAYHMVLADKAENETHAPVPTAPAAPAADPVDSVGTVGTASLASPANLTGPAPPNNSGRIGRLARIVFYAISFFVLAIIALILARRIVETCITWQEIPMLMFSGATTQDAFYGRLIALGRSQSEAIALFAVSCAATTAAVALTNSNLKNQ